MSTEVKRRRDSALIHETFTGANAEITVNTTNNSLHVHDGITPSGHEISNDRKNRATFSNPDLLSNPGFDVGNILTETPTSHALGDQIATGWIAEGALTNATYTNGIANATTGAIYQDVPITGKLEFITQLTASCAMSDGAPFSDYVTFTKVGDVYRVRVDLGASSGVFSAKFEEGKKATRHSIGAINAVSLQTYEAVSVDDMITGVSQFGSVKHRIGQKWSIYGQWKVKTISSPMTIADFESIGPANVKDFGATGDGSTDDYESLQKCFDVGIDVHLPKGEYKKDGTININSSNVKVTADSAQLIEEGFGKASVFIAAGLSDIHLDGLKIKGLADGTQENFGYGINFGVGCTDFSVSNCVLDGFNGGIFSANTSTRMRFSGNTFRNMFYIGDETNGAHGMGILLEACRDTSTIGNIFEETVQRHHIYYGTNAADRTIKGYTHSIVGNVFLGKSLASYVTGFEYLVKIMSNRNVTITGNVFRGGVGHVWITQSVPSEEPANISIVGNSFESARKGDASDSSCIGSEFSTIRGVTISGNTFQDNDVRAHVLLDTTIGCTIQNNNIGQTQGGHGIEIQKPASDLTIHNNAMRILDTYRGIFVNSDASATPSTDVSVRGNDINGGTFGIFFRYIPTAFIAENYIKNITDTAIYSFDDFSGVIKDNVINTVPTGINLRGPAGTKAKVYNNLIEGTTDRRIYAQDGVQLVKPFKDAVSNDTAQRFDSVEANSPPTTGAWSVGDEVRYRSPVASGFVGAICITAGTPGTWKQFGAIQA